ncbi:MAG: hypothetical protein E7331_05665 [Clostridiales bacterium]|nr:hypothetical protein [Clostridiales bacterium]
MTKTLKAALAFRRETEALGPACEVVKDYVLRGRDIAPELKAKAEELLALRSEAIRDEMYYLEARAKEAGIQLPEDFLDGTALDPIVEPELYRIGPNFQVFELFSWYDPLETARFCPRKIITGREEKN